MSSSSECDECFLLCSILCLTLCLSCCCCCCKRDRIHILLSPWIISRISIIFSLATLYWSWWLKVFLKDLCKLAFAIALACSKGCTAAHFERFILFWRDDNEVPLSEGEGFRFNRLWNLSNKSFLVGCNILNICFDYESP